MPLRFHYTNEVMEAYRVANSPNEPSPMQRSSILAWYNRAIYELSGRMNLGVLIEYIPGKDKILFFASTKGGVIWNEDAPSASRLERFAQTLGIKQQAQWHDAWVDAIQVCSISFPRDSNPIHCL